MSDLRKINNELKAFINEANFISNKCRNKLLKILGETFSVELPLENYANVDATITEEGNIVMRGDEYTSTSPCENIEEIEEINTEFNLYNLNSNEFDVVKMIDYLSKDGVKDIKQILMYNIDIFFTSFDEFKDMFDKKDKRIASIINLEYNNSDL